MARAEPRFKLHPVALTAALCAVGQAQGQGTAAPAGSPGDVRYTPLTAGEARLHPQLPDDQAQAAASPLRASAMELTAAASPVARVVVEVDRNHIPADGQTAAIITVRLFDAKRSEERRVGKECRRLCRSRWSPYH
jgi:hypothetical protein